MRKLCLRMLWLALGGLLAAISLEAALRLLPVSIGPYRTAQFERWPLVSSEAHTPYAYSQSWSLSNAHRGQTNNYGHIAPFDYKPGSQPVIVVGDSFVESLMNDYDDTLQAQLAARLKAPEGVYGLGASGLSASDYMALARLARDEFRPSAAVFLVIDGDLSESLGPHLGYHYLVPDGQGLRLDYAPLNDMSVLKKVRKLVGDISIYRYFQVNLHFLPDQIFNSSPKPAPPAVAKKPDVAAQRQVAEWLLAGLPASLGLPPKCIVLLMDSDRYAIYRPADASPRKDSPEARQYLVQQARALGFKVADLDPVFRAHYAAHQTKFDHWPADRHWNRVGHGIGATEADRLLHGDDPETSCMGTPQAGR